MSLINHISDELHKLNDKGTVLMLSFELEEGIKLKLVTLMGNRVIGGAAELPVDYAQLASGKINDRAAIQELFKRAKASLEKPD